MSEPYVPVPMHTEDCTCPPGATVHKPNCPEAPATGPIKREPTPRVRKR